MKSRSLLNISIIWFVFCLLIVVLLPTSTKADHNILAYFTATSYVFCIYNWIKTGNTLTSLYSFFVVYAFACNCSQQLLYSFGFDYQFLTAYYGISLSSMIVALKYQLICIAALNIATVIAGRKNKISKKELIDKYKSGSCSKDKDYKILRYIYFLCFVGTMYSAYNIFLIRSSMSYHEYMYEASKDVNTMFYFGYFYAFMGIRYVFRNRMVLFTYASWFILLTVFLYLGLRVQAIPYICYFIICIPITHSWLFKKKYWPFWTAACFFFVILLGLISSTRDTVGNSLSEASQGWYIDFLIAISDIGSPSQTIVNVIDSIHGGLEHAQTVLYFLITVIPESVFKIPHELISEIMPFGGPICESPGSYMSHYMGSAGLGFSFISESYLNFGWLGFLYIFVYGYLIIWAEKYAYKAILLERYFPITLLLLLARQIFYSRGDLCLCNNYIAYMCFTFVIYTLLGKKISIK